MVAAGGPAIMSSVPAHAVPLALLAPAPAVGLVVQTKRGPVVSDAQYILLRMTTGTLLVAAAVRQLDK